MAEASGDRRLAVLAAAELANAMADMGHPDEAAELARRAVELATQLHQAYITCMAFDAQAYLCWLRGDWAAALEARQRIATAAADTDNRLIPMVNDPALAEVYLELGQPERALETLRLALQIAGESDSPIPQARALHARARIRFALGEADRGTADFRRAVEICERWKSRLLQAQVLLNWGRLQIEGEPPPAGRRTLQGALDLFAQCGAQHWVGQTRAALQEEAQRGQGPAH
jgi:tetratricopeptide (TPR) repeat protein